MAKKANRSGTFHRTFTINRAAIDKENRTMEVAFSSEEPVQRWHGYEILDHSEGSVDLSRLNNGGPFLKDHNTSNQVGVIEQSRVDPDRVGRATIRFSTSDRGEEEFQEFVSGIRSKISVGYLITDEGERDVEAEGRMEDLGDARVYRFKSWQPYEISSVAVPADDSVGVGRSEDFGAGVRSDEQDNPTQNNKPKEEMAKTEEGVVEAPQQRAIEVNEDEIIAKAQNAERKRQVEIRKFGKRASVAESEVDKAIEDGVEFGTFTRSFAEGSLATVAPSAPKPDLEIGMSQSDIKRFAIVKCMREMTTRRGLTGLEKEVSEATAERAGLDYEGAHIPLDVMLSDVNGNRRDLEAGDSAEGGYSVATDLGGMIELLRNKSRVMQLGATQLTGLVGDLSLPRQDGAATASWVDEEGTVPDTDQTFGQLALNPKRLAARTAYSDRLLAQSSISVEQFVRNDIMQITAIELDRTSLHGSGASNQPLGLDGTSGINSVTFGAAPTWAKVVEFETDVEGANGDIGTMAFLATPSVKGKWKTTVRVSGTDSIFLMNDNNEANGYPFTVTNNITGNIVFFGVWSELIVATWGAMSLITDPFTKAASGQRVITACSFHDIGVRQPSAFAVSTDAGNQ